MKDYSDEYEGEHFEKIEFTAANLSGVKFIDCTFKGCRLNGLTISKCHFTDCLFDDCDLSLIVVKGVYFSRVQVIRSKAIGIHWFDAGDPFSIYFEDSLLSYSSFAGKAFKKARFVNCIAKETDFSDCDLTAADFTGTDLEQARFAGTDLSMADLSQAHHYSIDPRYNKLKKARFSMPAALGLLDALDIVIE